MRPKSDLAISECMRFFSCLHCHRTDPIYVTWGLFTPGHFVRLSDRIAIRSGKGQVVNAPRNAFETDINPIAQTTSGVGLGRIPDETGQV